LATEQSRTLFETPLQAVILNIRLGWKWMEMTNALSYSGEL